MNLEKVNRGCLKKKILKKFENYIFTILRQPPISSIQNNFYQDQIPAVSDLFQKL